MFWLVPGVHYATLEIYTPFVDFERASISYVNAMVCCICYMPWLFIQIYETWFGNGYTVDYENILFVAGLRSI